MKAQINWNIGKAGVGFGVAAEAEVPEALVPSILSCGLKFLLQRVTEVDDVLGGYAMVNGKRERVKGYTRSAVPFSQDLATALEKVLGTVEFPESTKENPVTMPVSIVVRVATGKATEPVYQREKLKFVEKESTEEGLEGWLKRFCNYEGPTHTEDGEDYAVPALQAAKKAIDEFLKKNI